MYFPYLSLHLYNNNKKGVCCDTKIHKITMEKKAVTLRQKAMSFYLVDGTTAFLLAH